MKGRKRCNLILRHHCRSVVCWSSARSSSAVCKCSYSPKRVCVQNSQAQSWGVQRSSCVGAAAAAAPPASISGCALMVQNLLLCVKLLLLSAKREVGRELLSVLDVNRHPPSCREATSVAPTIFADAAVAAPTLLWCSNICRIDSTVHCLQPHPNSDEHPVNLN